MTTTEFVLAASTPNTALSHLALYGLAAILDNAGHPDIRLSWTNTMDPRPRITSTLPPDTLATTVRNHAARHHGPGSWLHDDITLGGTPRGVMSPRISKLSPEDWSELQHHRHRVLDTLPEADARLDRQLIAALGEPCYWSLNPKGEALQDDAASRWEMQPRNRGSEIVTNRLRPLAAAVARRDPQDILTGLTGETTHDAVGSNKSDSRTATGLAPLGPTDDALAWCGLWGISQLPVTHRAGTRSRTTGHHGPPGKGTMFLPAWTRPWPLARLRTLLTSPTLRTYIDPDAEDIDRSTAQTWLTQRHIDAIITFPIHRYGSDNAPERRTHHGTIHTTTPP